MREVRPARLGDIEAMQVIEVAAGRLFAEIGMDDVADDPPFETEVLAKYIDAGRAWVAEANDQTVGYALADVVDRRAHIEQVSVHPDHGRQGLGRMLIEAVVSWARDTGLDGITLLTFRDVPWNGPYYVSLGFRPLDDAALTPELRALREHERALGLDCEARFAMLLDLATLRDSHRRESSTDPLLFRSRRR